MIEGLLGGWGVISVAEREDLAAILERLRGTNGVVASTVISRDGIPLASDLPEKVDREMLALRTAFMQGIGELVMESVEDEAARTVIIVADEHYISTTPIDDSSILVVVLDRNVDVGGMIPAILGTADSIKRSINGD
jgi:predicted regulator of Ras-like GTPase activity (Roadblock/LC7/MglB family)